VNDIEGSSDVAVEGLYVAFIDNHDLNRSDFGAAE
jgi:hypothetical protein